MPDLPTFRGRAVSNVPLHAEPIWTLAGRCAFISDGSGAWVVVADLVDGGADSLRLPALSLAEPSAADLAQWARELEDARRWGIAPAGIEDVEPTARARWADLIVDPAGLLWVEPWRPPSLRDGPLTALTLNPATGEVRSVDVPRFPDAFLPGGRFVALASDDGLPIVETYVLG